jgi:Zinc finger, C2H2 type
MSSMKKVDAFSDDSEWNQIMVDAISKPNSNKDILEPPTKRSRIMMITCEFCKKEFSRKDNLQRHQKNIHNFIVPDKKPSIFKCRVCTMSFPRTDNRSKHEKRAHPSLVEPSTSAAQPQPPTSAVVQSANTFKISSHNKFCTTCDNTTEYKENHEVGPLHKFKSNPEHYGKNVVVDSTAFKNRIFTFKFKNSQDIFLPEEFLKSIGNSVQSILHDASIEHTYIKYNMGVICLYIKPKADTEIEELPTQEASHYTKMEVLTSTESTEEKYNRAVERIMAKMSEFQERDSGWTLVKVIRLELNINKCNPLRGNSYIPLPPSIKRKEAVVNIQNADEYCFAWAVNSAIHPVQWGCNPNRISSYQHYSESLILDDITFPMKIADIKKFEILNPNISINVFGIEEKKIIGPLYHTKQHKVNHINLLFLENEGRTHYCWIKNMSR